MKDELRTKITTGDAVLALRALRTSHPARLIASYMNAHGFPGVDSRAVATALRGAVKDGRVTCNYRKRGADASWRFVRLTPRTSP